MLVGLVVTLDTGCVERDFSCHCGEMHPRLHEEEDRSKPVQLLVSASPRLYYITWKLPCSSWRLDVSIRASFALCMTIVRKDGDALYLDGKLVQLDNSEMNDDCGDLCL